MCEGLKSNIEALKFLYESVIWKYVDTFVLL